MGESSRQGVGGSAEVGEDLGEANDGRSRRERRLGRGGVSPGPRSPASNRDRESEGLSVKSLDRAPASGRPGMFRDARVDANAHLS